MPENRAKFGTVQHIVQHIGKEGLVPNIIVRLNDDPHVPFRFRRGDLVAWRRGDRTLDPEYRGTVVDGACEYTPGSGGAYKDTYIVQRADGLQFAVGHFDIEKVG